MSARAWFWAVTSMGLALLTVLLEVLSDLIRWAAKKTDRAFHRANRKCWRERAARWNRSHPDRPYHVDQF